MSVQRERAKGVVIRTIPEGTHQIEFAWSGNEKFPIIAKVDGKSTGRMYKSCYSALPLIRKSLLKCLSIQSNSENQGPDAGGAK